MRGPAVIVALVLAGVACGPAATPPPEVPRDGVVTVAALHRGEVVYEARRTTLRGASMEVELRPARQVEVSLLDAAGVEIARGRTDDEGRYAIEAPAAAASVEIESRIAVEHHDLAVAADRRGETTHGVRAELAAPDQSVRIVIGEAAPSGPAGAFHILDTMLEGARAVRAWTGRRLPPFFAYWGRGVTTSWSYYHGACPEGAARFCIELLGGEPGQQATTDTDEHDEPIVLHEFGHFVMDHLTTSSSHGGDHPPGALIDPGLAWEEGRASWFATAVLRDPFYRDTIGVEPRGSLRIDHDVEREPGGLRGIGSERGVMEILWDLSDGDGELPDADGDGIALGARAVFQAMVAMRDEREGAYPTIASFLRFLIETGAVQEQAVKDMLGRGGHPDDLLTAEWPIDLAIGESAQGKVDGLTQPAPSGGPNRPRNGLDALRAYRVHVPQRARVVVRLTIDGTGYVRDDTDLDVELRDIRSELVESARTEKRVETISAVVEPGWYVVYVRDGGNANRATFSLRVTIGR